MTRVIGQQDAVLALFDLHEEGVLKVCCTCREAKPLDAFYLAPLAKAPSGRYPRCRDCSSRHAVDWRTENLEEARARDRRRYREHGEAARTRHRGWLAANQDRVREYRQLNREARSAYNAEWRKANPEKVREKSSRRRAQLRDNGVWTVSDRDLLRLYASPCAACGSREDIQADHIIPVTRGGRHSIGNLQPLCGSCNKSKMNRLPVEWRYGRSAPRTEVAA